MAITSEQCSQEYVGNSTASSFPVPFRVLDKSHLIVTKIAGGAETVLVEGSDYTLSNTTAYIGWQVNLTDSDPGNFGNPKVLATGEKLRLNNAPPFLQPARFRGQSAFRAENHEDAFDYVTILVQNLRDQVGSLKQPTPFAGTLAGTANGVNKTFTLTDKGTPLAVEPLQVTVWKNFPLVEGVGYTRDGSTVTFTEAPAADDTLYAQGSY